MWDQEGLEFAVRMLAEIAETVPVRRLHFLPDESAIACALDALRSELSSGEPGGNPDDDSASNEDDNPR